jgi:hypothetical protein
MISFLHQFWGKEKSLSIVLIVLSIHLFLVIPLGQEIIVGRIIGFVFYFFLLTAGLKYVTGGRKNSVLILIAVLSILMLALRLFFEEAWVDISSDIFIITYCSALAWIVLLKTFSKGPITIYRIEGSIVVYLLIGLIFANLYYFIFHIEGLIAFNGLKAPDIKDFLYFSFTTLTTVGYGDISPALPFSRSAANLEALVGQLYPAILIARLVSMEFINRE